MSRASVFLGIALALLSLTPTAGAQEKSSSKTYTYDPGEIVIKGKIQKPMVSFMVIREKNVNADVLVLKESFLPKIAESVERPPF